MLQFDTAVHERMLYDSALGRKFDRGYVNQHVEAAKRAVEQIGRSPCAARFRLSPTADVSRCGKLREQRLIYSVTSSGQASSEGGTMMPSTLAVLRLMIRSTFADCWIGRFLPLAYASRATPDQTKRICKVGP